MLNPQQIQALRDSENVLVFNYCTLNAVRYGFSFVSLDKDGIGKSIFYSEPIWYKSEEAENKGHELLRMIKGLAPLVSKMELDQLLKI